MPGSANDADAYFLQEIKRWASLIRSSNLSAQ
jgi:hypothetical protein